MSASPTRCDAPAPLSAADPGLPVQEGNRVFESLARQETLRALLAFSALHAQIGDRRALAAQSGDDWDLFQTERFVLDEVLQLICDRCQAIMQADGVLVALADGPAFICRASSGPLVVERGVHLVPDSEFLQECRHSGRILRCDDADVDKRVEFDLSRLLGARSTLLVPLRGNRAVLGVLQAFSRAPFAFSDDDVRSLDLFAELVLSALKPEDQDRRLNWLTEVAGAVLAPVLTSTIAETRVEQPGTGTNQQLEIPVSEDPFLEAQPAPLPEPPEELPASVFITDQPSLGRQEPIPKPFPVSFTMPASSRPGLSVVAALVVVATLFSAGVWWGMRNQGSANRKSISAASRPAATQPEIAAPSNASGSDHLLDAAKPDPETAPALPPFADKLAVLPKVTGVRHWTSSVGSTVVIDVEDLVPYEVHRLSSPERIYFDLHDTALVPNLEGKSIDVGDPSLTRVRVAQPVTGVTRVVLDTRDGSNFAVSMESSPYRLVVELRGSVRPTLPAKGLLASTGRPQPAQTMLLPQKVKPEDEQLHAKAGRFRIALDAGHGGWDLGTVGREGLLEKDLVLDVTQRLGGLLKSRLGAEVVFTRTDDEYLPLEQRAAVANQTQADLFVSVHANYSNSASARGVETYYTNTFSPPGSLQQANTGSAADPASHEIQKQENGTAAQPSPVALSAGELHEKIEESRHLAASVQHALYTTLAMHTPSIRDRGVKDSAFVVLTGTTMPAILTEISFVSSPADEQKLRNDTYRQQIAEALYKGIARYEAGVHHVKMAQVQPGAAAQR